jgi:hypothetical protein
MPRFFFHLHNRIGAVPDEEGQELPGLEAATSVAVQNIRSILAEDARTGVIDLKGRVDIADERGQVRATVRYAEAVQVKPEDGP